MILPQAPVAQIYDAISRSNDAIRGHLPPNEIELLVSEADVIGFNRRTICTLQAALSENLLSDAGDEGRLREKPVQITETRYVPSAIPQVIDECFESLLGEAAAIPDPFEQAFFAMVHIPYLQPFTDVNKRTSRLAANIPLVIANLCPLSFVDVPERAYIEGTLGIYELTRVELIRDVFIWAYERSCAQHRVLREAMGQPDPVRLRYRLALERARVPSLAFLFDEHVNRRSLEILRAADVEHVTAVGLSGADDPSVFRWAQREGRIIVTRNHQDFAPMVRALAARGESFPGVLFHPTSLRHSDVDGHASALLTWIRAAVSAGANPVANGFGWLIVVA